MSLPGGTLLEHSVRRGLAALPGRVRLVLVHDAARCLVAPELHRDLLERAHREAGPAAASAGATDDAASWSVHGEPVHVIPGDLAAVKITTRGDLEYASWLLTQAAGRPPARRLPPVTPPSHPAQPE